MDITIKELSKFKLIDKVIIYSIGLNLYQVSIEMCDKELYIANNDGGCYVTHNKQDLIKLFRSIPYRTMVLRHTSEYDEMIGFSNKDKASNTLEVPLKDNHLS